MLSYIVPDEIAELLGGYDVAVQEIAAEARVLVQEVLPDTVEQVDRPAHLLGYGRDRSYKRSICAVALHRRYVNLMFTQGVHLPDPDQLLEGTGKQARHVTLTSIEDVHRSGVRSLLEKAARLTP